MLLSRLSPHQELSHHCLQLVGGMAPWPDDSMDAALCEPAAPHLQAPHRAGSTFKLPQGVKGRPLPAHQLDMNAVRLPASSTHRRPHKGCALDPHIGANNSSGIKVHHKVVQCIPEFPLSNPSSMFH